VVVRLKIHSGGHGMGHGARFARHPPTRRDVVGATTTRRGRGTHHQGQQLWQHETRREPYRNHQREQH
jgi:hypothetical protein